MTGWIDEAKRTDLADVLQHLGIGHVSGRTCAPCPGCNLERRGSSDRRGPLNLHERGAVTLWHCKRCEAGGDVLDAVAFSRFDRKFSKLDRDDMSWVRRWFSDRGWCEARADAPRPPVRPAPPPVRRIGDGAARHNPDPPPAAEVSALWSACRPWGGETPEGWPEDPEDVAPPAYLLDRGYCPWAYAELGLDVVRIAPSPRQWEAKGWHSPGWWPAGWLGLFRLVFQAFDVRGNLASLHARLVPTYDRDRLVPICDGCGRDLARRAGPRPGAFAGVVERCECGWKPARKTTWPARCSAEELLFADAGGQAVLRGEPQHQDVLVVEGVTDLLRAALVAPRVPCAVIGFTSGGAQALGKIRWSQGVRVGIATDDDKAGDRYADAAARAMTIRPRRIKWGSLE